MLRVPAACNSQAWRVLSIGPAFPKYLLHSVILGAKCRWLIPLLPFLLCSIQPCHARGPGLRQAAPDPHCIAGILPSHSGTCSFALCLKCPEQRLWERGAWAGHGFSLECKRFVFWGVLPLWLKMRWQLWGWSRAALNCLWVMMGVYSRAHRGH